MTTLPATGAPASPDPQPQPPQPPLASDCCDSGCDRCVFDIHAEQMDHYATMLAAWRDRQATKPPLGNL